MLNNICSESMSAARMCLYSIAQNRGIVLESLKVTIRAIFSNWYHRKPE